MGSGYKGRTIGQGKGQALTAFEMTNFVLKLAWKLQEDLNVFVSDWGPGAKQSYVKATGNSRLVGAQIAM